MAVIDYQSIRCGSFAKLSLPSRVLIPVLSALSQPITGAISPEDAKHSNLSALSGLSVKSVKRALPVLASAGVISIVTHSGKPASIQYLPEARFSKLGRSQRPTSQVTQAYHVGHRDLPSSPQKEPQTGAVIDQNENGKNVALNNVLNTLKTTTPSHSGTSARSKIRESLILVMMKKVGADLVNSILEAMDFLNGEVENPNAFFRYFCNLGVVPDYKAARDRKRALYAQKKRDEAMAESQRQWNEQVEQFKRERNDPEAQKRIKAAQDEFWESISD